MSGPPPTPTVLRLMRGNPGKRPIRPEPQPPRTAEPPEPPSFLVGHAADEWWRVAPVLHQMGLLSQLDVAALAAYCVAYTRWRQAEEALAKMAEKDPVTGGMLIKGALGDARVNPLARVAANAARDMVAFASQFGMTAAARARIAAGPFGQPPGPGKFDGLLA
jgi:P27 family predicted phage terminase small subunit